MSQRIWLTVLTWSTLRDREIFIYTNPDTLDSTGMNCVWTFLRLPATKKRTRCVSLRLFSKIDFADVCMCVYTVCLIGNRILRRKEKTPVRFKWWILPVNTKTGHSVASNGDFLYLQKFFRGLNLGAEVCIPGLAVHFLTLRGCISELLPVG